MPRIWGHQPGPITPGRAAIGNQLHSSKFRINSTPMETIEVHLKPEMGKKRCRRLSWRSKTTGWKPL
jgi:hypothetical protein